MIAQRAEREREGRREKERDSDVESGFFLVENYSGKKKYSPPPSASCRGLLLPRGGRRAQSAARGRRAGCLRRGSSGRRSRTCVSLLLLLLLFLEQVTLRSRGPKKRGGDREVVRERGGEEKNRGTMEKRKSTFFFFFRPSLLWLSAPDFNTLPFNSPHQARHPGPDRAVPPGRLVEGHALVRDAVMIVAVAATGESAAGGVGRSCPSRERRSRVGPQARRGSPGAGSEHVRL